jgi:hypothetical protein
VYWAADGNLDHMTYSSASGTWSMTALDTLGAVASNGSIATVGPSLEAVYVGADGALYSDTWAGRWSSPPTPVAPAVDGGAGPPQLAALPPSSTGYAALAGYQGAGGALHYAQQRPDGTWTAEQGVFTGAVATAPPSVAANDVGIAGAVYLGPDGNAHYTALLPGHTSWTPPLGVTQADSPPKVARGICGDDAIAVVWSGGKLVTYALRGLAIAGPFTVPVPAAFAGGTKCGATADCAGQGLACVAGTCRIAGAVAVIGTHP